MNCSRCGWDIPNPGCYVCGESCHEKESNHERQAPRLLHNDLARCDGSFSIENGKTHWREGCETCLRRTAPRPDRVVMMQPPLIIAFECEYLIEP